MGDLFKDWHECIEEKAFLLALILGNAFDNLKAKSVGEMD